MRSLERTNPRVGALCFLGAVFAPMAAQNPVSAGLSLVGALLYTLALSEGKILKKGLLFGALVPVFAVFNGLFVHRGQTVLIYSGENPVTAEALFSGAISGVCIWAVLWWFLLFSRLFTSDKLMYLLGGAFPRLSLLLSVTLRYVPLLSRSARDIRQAQTGAGLYENGEGVAKLRGESRVFSALIGKSLEQGILTADAMAARGYGVGRRTSYGRYGMCPFDWFLFAVLAVLFAGAVGGMVLGASYTVYPRVAPPSFAGGLIFEIFTGALALIPAVTEKGEQIKWKRFCAKI